jgi:hypothetical protein
MAPGRMLILCSLCMAGYKKILLEKIAGVLFQAMMDYWS